MTFSNKLSRRSMLLLAAAGAFASALPKSSLAKALSLSVTYYDDFAPDSYMRDGKVTGVLVDSLNEVFGRRLGVALTHHGLPWTRAQQDVKEGRADAFCTIPTDARKEYVNFSREQLLKSDRVIVFAKNNPKAGAIRKIKKPEDLKPFMIGTYLGDSKKNDLFSGMNVDYAADVSQVLAKIAAGRVDLTIIGSLRWRYYARTLSIRDKLEDIWFSDAPGFYLGIRKDYADGVELLESFDKMVLVARKDGSLDRIIKTYS